ncbi:MAG: peptidase M23 [Chitinophagaceae bacterium]
MPQPLVEILRKNQPAFHLVVPFDAATDKLVKFDFTKNNQQISADILGHTEKFIAYINNKLQSASAKYGIGGYDELREVYSRSKLFSSDGEGTEAGEPRRLHLGIDIWGKPYTKVMAPLDGVVHSFAFNNNFGDYGATIILSHHIEGKSFYTLYGHLSLNSLKNLQPGMLMKHGDVFAEFGLPFENGQWPPHLHFQVIEDMQGYKGDYPGVCKFSEREKYLTNCPDADLILQMMKYAN